MSNRSKLAGLLAVSLLACMKPNPLAATLANGDDDTGETGSSDESGDGDSGDGDSGNDDSSHAALDLGSDPVCGSVEPYEPGCGSCLAAGCCELLAACAEVDDCPCLAACLLAGGKNGACRQACNNAQANKIPELQPLLDCAAEACDADCQ